MKIITKVKSCDYWKNVAVGTIMELIADGETELCIREGWAIEWHKKYRYALMPCIDFFHGVIQLDEYKKSLNNKCLVTGYKEHHCKHEILAELAELEAEMPRIESWEGDIRDKEIYVFAVPNELETSLGLVWKQDNNGSTFVISPVELPHLDEISD